MKTILSLLVILTALFFISCGDNNEADKCTATSCDGWEVCTDSGECVKDATKCKEDADCKEGDKTKATLKVIVKCSTEESREGLVNESKYNGDFISTNKKEYMLGEEIIIKNIGENELNLSIDRGTRASVYLGLPLLEVVEGGYAVFILFVFIGGIVFSIGENLAKRFIKGKSQKEEKEVKK